MTRDGARVARQIAELDLERSDPHAFVGSAVGAVAVQSRNEVEEGVMPRLLSRRAMVAAGGAAALAPISFRSVARAAPTSGSLVTLLTPIRIFDSRVDDVPLGRAKLESDNTVIVTVSVPDEPRFLTAAFLNVTITETEGAGFLRVSGTDSSGTQPVPATSNINWSHGNQTVANLALTAVGSEFGVDIFAGGGGRTHVIVDVQGYVPFE